MLSDERIVLVNRFDRVPEHALGNTRFRIDVPLVGLGAQSDRIVVDGRITWHNIQPSCHILWEVILNQYLLLKFIHRDTSYIPGMYMYRNQQYDR